MQFVLGSRFTGAETTQVTDGLLHRLGFLARRLDHLDLAMPGGQQHHPTSHLRDAIEGTIDDVVPDLVAESFQRIDEIVEDLVLGDGWHVLHRDDVGHRAFREPRKLVEQAPLAILAIEFVTLGVGGKGLARRTARQDRHIGVAEQPLEFVGCDRADVTLEESGLAVVLFVGEAACGIEIDSCDDGKALQDEAMGQPARATE